MRIELTFSAWKAEVLPLDEYRIKHSGSQPCHPDERSLLRSASVLQISTYVCTGLLSTILVVSNYPLTFALSGCAVSFVRLQTGRTT